MPAIFADLFTNEASRPIRIARADQVSRKATLKTCSDTIYLGMTTGFCMTEAPTFVTLDRAFFEQLDFYPRPVQRHKTVLRYFDRDLKRAANPGNTHAIAHIIYCTNL